MTVQYFTRSDDKPTVLTAVGFVTEIVAVDDAVAEVIC